MKFKELKHDKGSTGLSLFLTLVVTLFVIGLLVFIFALMGGQFQDVENIKASESSTVTQNLVLLQNAGSTLTACNGKNQGTVTSVTSVVNESGAVTVPATNYSTATCTLSAIGTTYNGTTVNVTYTYTYAGSGWDVINGTTGSISNVTDWYEIFIVIGAMVVLILLTVMIIIAIKGSGLIDNKGTGAGNVGSA